MQTKFVRWTAAACGAVLALSVAALPALAQSAAPVAAPTPGAASAAPVGKPLAVVAINSYEHLMQDIDYLGTLVNMPGASQMVEGVLGNMTGGKGLAGLDKTKPIGLMLDMTMMMPNYAAYVPVTDQAALLALLQPMGISSTDMGNGMTQIKASGQDVYARTAPGWMIVGREPTSVQSMPTDPSAALTALTQQYDIALQINMQSLPPQIMPMAMSQMGAAAAQLKKLDGETDEAFAARQKAVQEDLASTQQMMKDLDQLNFGLAISSEQQKVYLDINVVAMPGTKLANELAASAQSTTNFAGFVQPDAAATLAFSGKVTGSQAAMIEQLIGQLRAKLSASIQAEAKPEQRAGLQAAFNEIIDAVVATVKSGSVDGGAVVQMAPNSASVVVGGLIADPSKIEGGLKKLSEALKGSGSDALPEIKWAAETHGGVTFHTMQAPVADDQGKALFGDKLEVIVGLGPKAAYLAWGRSAGDALKKVIDASAAAPGQKASPLELTVTLGKVLDSMKSVAPPEKQAMLQMISSVVAGAAGHDHVHLIAQPATNGMQVRFELEQGVLQAIGTSALMGATSGPAGPPPGAVPPAGG